MNNLYTFATATSEESNDLLSMLGIDVPTLIFQIVAFLILVFVLGKWVFPVFVGIIDKRQADIDAGLKAAHDAQAQANDSEAEIAKLLKEARTEASEIVSTAIDEATALVADAEKKAKTKSEAIVQSARDELQKDVIAARKMLHNETIDLVAMATEKVVGKTVSSSVDAGVIKDALKESK
jgi:F-type H+-transporting ATPase subunit b